MVLVDTSGLYAVLDADDVNHEDATRVWNELLEGEGSLVVSNYVIVETAALLQSRLGVTALRTFVEQVLPALDTVWISEEEHGAALSALLVAGRRKLSLVDCSSFEVARRLGITTVFAFDRHFEEQGLRRPK